MSVHYENSVYLGFSLAMAFTSRFFISPWARFAFVAMGSGGVGGFNMFLVCMIRYCEREGEMGRSEGESKQAEGREK